MIFTRRAALLGLASAWSLGRVSIALADAPTEQRFVVIILRGALDGLSAVVPYGDPTLATYRPTLIPPAIGQPDGMLDLGGFWGLHPALAPLHPLYASGELLPVQAVAGPYRSRSHFEAQDYLESGADHRMTSGWLNRLVTALPAAARSASPGDPAIAVGLSMPLLLRGPAEVGSWAPSHAAHPPPDLYARIAALNAPDRITGPAIAEALRARSMSSAILADAPPQDKPNAFPALAATCGTLLAAPNGPRIAALEINGWDTHTNQRNGLHGPLSDLANGLAALQASLGPAWNRTAVLVMTEFGRTVRQNGTGGTDHGTGTIAFLAGGRIEGGRVAGTWPGLAPANLLDNRDLQPTTDLRALAKGLIAPHFSLPPAALAQIFPDSAAASPTPGLFRA